jgi:hypothetical protein
MTKILRHVVLASILPFLPFLVSAQKITLTGNVLVSKAPQMIFERLKNERNWKTWKDSEYSTNVDSNGNFKISLPIATNGWWKISIGKLKSKVYLNATQNAHLELDQNLGIVKILRQDVQDSPFHNSF